MTTNQSQETRTDVELAHMLLDQIKDYWTTQDGRLLVNFYEKGVWRMVPGCEDLEWSQRETLVMLPGVSHRIQYATHAQAYEWLHSSLDQAYCLDVLGISPNDPDAAKLIHDLEKRFQELLKDGAE